MKKALHFILFLSFIGPMTAQTPSNLWTPQGIGLLPAGHDVLSIAVVNKDIAWAATNLSIIGPIPGNNVSKILKTTNGGTTWQTYNLSAATGRAGLEIYAIDSLVAWITTSSYGAGLPSDLYKTTALTAAKRWSALLTTLLRRSTTPYSSLARVPTWISVAEFATILATLGRSNTTPHTSASCQLH